jgi:hypothetical protein
MIENEAKTDIVEEFRKVPGKTWSTHHFRAKKPVTNHQMSIDDAHSTTTSIDITIF